MGLKIPPYSWFQVGVKRSQFCNSPHTGNLYTLRTQQSTCAVNRQEAPEVGIFLPEAMVAILIYTQALCITRMV